MSISIIVIFSLFYYVFAILYCKFTVKVIVNFTNEYFLCLRLLLILSFSQMASPNTLHPMYSGNISKQPIAGAEKIQKNQQMKRFSLDFYIYGTRASPNHLFDDFTTPPSRIIVNDYVLLKMRLFSSRPQNPKPVRALLCTIPAPDPKPWQNISPYPHAVWFPHCRFHIKRYRCSGRRPLSVPPGSSW